MIRRRIRICIVCRRVFFVPDPDDISRSTADLFPTERLRIIGKILRRGQYRTAQRLTPYGIIGNISVRTLRLPLQRPDTVSELPRLRRKTVGTYIGGYNVTVIHDFIFFRLFQNRPNQIPLFDRQSFYLPDILKTDGIGGVFVTPFFNDCLDRKVKIRPLGIITIGYRTLCLAYDLLRSSVDRNTIIFCIANTGPCDRFTVIGEIGDALRSASSARNEEYPGTKHKRKRRNKSH